MADSAGQVNRKDLKKDLSYTINVTATGYKAFTGSVSDLKNGEVRLERDFILGPDVIVSSGHVCICRRLYVCQQQQVSQECGMQVKLINEQTTEKTSKFLAKRELSVFPNPVQRGQLVSLKLLQEYFPAGTVRVLTLDGKQLFSMTVNGNQQQGLIRLPTQQGWASGVYILQLVYANGRVGASEKVILQ
ncbi:MAG TPA: T9SS type A sorting domain-containing protein [Chitinophagaceae bacterium]|nr:T9SS type A sorting domain-containing protein [Chitinophagaceae bacterium]